MASYVNYPPFIRLTDYISLNTENILALISNFNTLDPSKVLDLLEKIEARIDNDEIIFNQKIEQLSFALQLLDLKVDELQKQLDLKQNNFNATNGLQFDDTKENLSILINPLSKDYLETTDAGLNLTAGIFPEQPIYSDGLLYTREDNTLKVKSSSISTDAVVIIVDETGVHAKSNLVEVNYWVYDDVIGRVSVNEALIPNFKYLDITDSNDLPTNILGVAFATELTHAINLGQTQTLISKSNWWMANNGELLVNVSNFTTAPYSSINIGGVAFVPIPLRGVAEGTDPSGAVPYSQLLKLLPDNIFKKTGSGQVIWDDSIIQFVSTLDLQGKNNTAIPVVGVANATQADGAVNLAQLQAKTERAINLQGKNTDQWNLDFNFISGKKYRVYYNFMAVSKEASMQEKVLIWKNTPIIIDTYFEQQNTEQAIFQVRCYSNNVQMLKMTTAGKLTRGWILGVQEIL